MDKIEFYLEIVPLWFVVIAPIAAILAFVVVPARLRLDASLIVAMVWLTTGLLLELGFVQGAAKSTGFGVYLLVAAAAFLDRGPKRPLPALAWLYVLTAAQGFFYILNVSDFGLALVIRFQWLLLVVAALLVARTITDEASLFRIVRALAIGHALALLLPLSELVLHPSTAFAATGRFDPYGANPNHIGMIFALTPALTGYMAMKTRGRLGKSFWIAVACTAAVCGLITASRSTMVVMLGVSLPLAIAWTKRPALVVVGGVLVAGVLFVAMTFSEDVNYGRFVLDEIIASKRVQTLAEHPYWPIIVDRPLFGVLETEGESFRRAESENLAHAHNAYWELLYFGGLTYGLPMLFLVASTLLCTYACWYKRRQIGADPVLINLMVALMVMAYAHGFVNHAIHYPTTTISFIHVLVSVFFMGLAADIWQGRAALGAAVDEAEDGWYDEDYGEESDGYGAVHPVA